MMLRIKRQGLKIVAAALAACSLLLTVPFPAQAGEDQAEDKWMSKVVSLQGDVMIKHSGQTDWTPAQLDERLYTGDTLRVAPNSRAAVVLRNDSVLRIDQQTTLVFQGIEEERSFLLNLIKGAAYFFSRQRHSLEVATPFVNGVVEGTEFLVRVNEEKTEIILFEGAMLAQNSHGEINISKGQAVEAFKDRPPRTTIPVHPRDAVQWALYYPPVLAVRPDEVPIKGPYDWQTRLHRSIQAYVQGNLSEAFDAIADLGDTVTDARFYAYRAGLDLAVGQTEEAGRNINQALARDARSSAAMALRSIIAVVQNRKEDALKDAESAVVMDTRSAAAHIARSYALQARFDLNSALSEAKTATEVEPANNIAWARLAELRLSTGDLDKALAAAQKAAELPPAIAHTHSILGYAYLTQIKIDQARQAFTQAIELDSAAPLPRLGLGLAKIRQGDLKAGRAEIEIAAGLDPDNALIRSYLGKAYFDEKRDPLDERQFEIAKKLDPNDPTPWFYDAIRKETLNRPVEALQDLQKSIELNDNRAVYRSRLLLDEDLAARGASLGRIYNDLSFQEMALREGYKSLAIDPTNFSAHRLLADSYLYRPRMKIARVSELLQSQLLQPISTRPMQPQLAESNLYVLEGMSPGNPSFSEFGSLFNRNQAELQLNAACGDNSTFGNEIVGYGLWNNFSLNLGYYHFQTDGFRENNDQTRNLFSAIGQYGFSHKTTIMAEYRYTENEMGDLPLRFDPEDYFTNLRTNQQIRFLRIGFQTEASPLSHFIFTVAGSSFPENQQYTSYQYKLKEEGILAEAQYIINLEQIKLTSGIGYFSSGDEFRFENSSLPQPHIEKDDPKHFNAYFYSSINYSQYFIWTIGGSGDFLERTEVDRDQFNPKLGLSLLLNSKTTLRTAVFRTLKRSLLLDQTVEPTQIAGFNQFYDSVNGTDAWRYGLAVDQQFNWNLSGGIEFTQSELDVPFPGNTAEWDEQQTRIFLGWAPHKRISLNMEYLYETYKREDMSTRSEPFTKLSIQRFPISVNFYHPSGLIARLKNTYIDQRGTFGDQSSDPVANKGDNFWIMDASIGYRLHKRFGTLTINARNLLDEKFHFQDTDPTNPTVQPKRAIIGLLTINF